MGASYCSYNLISKYVTLFDNIVNVVGCGQPVSGARGSFIKCSTTLILQRLYSIKSSMSNVEKRLYPVQCKYSVFPE